jgi:hypothetical protein
MKQYLRFDVLDVLNNTRDTEGMTTEELSNLYIDSRGLE